MQSSDRSIFTRTAHSAGVGLSSPGWILLLTVVAVVLGGLAAINPGVGIVAAVAVGALLGIWIVPVSGLLMLWPFSLAFWTPLFQVAGYNVTLTDCVTLLLWVRCGVRLFRAPGTTGRQLTGAAQLGWAALAPVLPFMLAGAVTMGSTGLITSLTLFFKRWGVYAILPLAFSADLSPGGAERRSWSYVLASAAAVSTGLMTGGGLDAGPDSRATGVLFNPNTLGVFAFLGVNVIFSMIRRYTGYKRWMLFGLLLVHMAAIAVSGSRTAWVALAVSVLYWTIEGSKRSLIVLGIIGAGIVMLTPLGDVSRSRVTDALTQRLDEGNVAARLDASAVGLKLFADHPFGVGIGNIGKIGRDYLARYGRGDYGLLTLQAGFTTTDNVYLDALLEGGIPALILFLIALYVMWRLLPSGTAGRAALAGILVAGLSAALLHVPFISGAVWYIVANELRSAEGGSAPHVGTPYPHRHLL